MKRTNFIKSLSIIFISIFCHFAQAQVFQGPLSRALGGSGRAGLESSESALLNPALVPLAIDGEFNLMYGDGSSDRAQHQQFIGVGTVDNGEGIIVPGSLHYIRTRNTGVYPSAVSGELWHFAIGQKLFLDGLVLGLSGFRWSADPDGEGAKSQWNGSFGALYSFNSAFGLAYVWDNFIGAPKSIPEGLRLSARHSLGAMFTVGDVARLRFDLSKDQANNPDDKLIYQFGLESRSSSYAIIRLGAKADKLREQDFMTFGLGFNGPRLKVDYSFEKNLKRTGDALHSVDMRVPF